MILRAIEKTSVPGTPFLQAPLGLNSVPSSRTLRRQRLDASCGFLVRCWPAQLNQELLSSTINAKAIDFGTRLCGYTPVDSRFTLFAMDNVDPKKELVDVTLRWRGRLLPFCGCDLVGNLPWIALGSFARRVCSILHSDE